MPRANSFRIGKVTGYLRSRIWYLCYFEHGQRKRPRVGPDRDAARQLAARVSDQLESGAPSAFSFEPLSISKRQGSKAEFVKGYFRREQNWRVFSLFALAKSPVFMSVAI